VVRNWVKGIATLPHKLLSGDKKGVKEAISQMTKGATEFADGLRIDIEKASADPK
jgi:hypothetical protein